MPQLTATTLGRTAASLGTGLLAGAVGTVMHRSIRPWGLVLCLALVLAVALTTRAWAGWPAYVAASVGVLVAVQVLSSEGPGGDVLVPAGDGWGWAWVIGAVVALGSVALVPRRWVEDTPPDAP
ncbi:MAG: hypothetical protein J7503_15810 [Cellulomonas iranensis]|uniref:hypothetical protein n=1 Tax=Cellulomonas iranensis TaxID=76862 RepID=UPI001B05714A|nr:hypothetical protein [Cellulomonas iranensis]MBO9570272.1 hypothetical protein [Cellulomonas iranensis]